MERIITNLMNEAMENGVECIAYQLPPDFPSFFTIRNGQKTLIINLNWSNKKELPFMVAHELSHAFTCDKDDIEMYKKSIQRNKYEYKANMKAVKMLIPFYIDELDEPEQININNFMKIFKIPNDLYDVCCDELKKQVI